ncbi:NADP-dependent malic enzyme [Hyphomicrobium sp.]|uniref:NADP-dependent malic enzyme n=1 Tax=Hyphomicrobium sp. TaxID=82 RepID=UPI002FDEA533
MSHKSQRTRITAQEALQFHSQGKPGKLEITPTKPLVTQRDLSLAYSPGVAAPVEAIAETPSLAYDYTNKGNLVAVVSNGTAILGLGNLGALASKPVMEGKGALFKRFADIDAIDLLVDTEDVDAFINSVRYLGPSFGGINLEDIRAPDCFIIEERLKELLDIPVFHDDQHGTAIIAAAGLLNALELTGRNIAECKLVVNGAGAAGIACIELATALGIQAKNVILCDTKGVIYEGREAGMNQWKSAYASQTEARTLAEALDGADAFFGLSAKGAMTREMVAAMAPKPIIFAMANPDPEITPEDVAAVRNDAIVATGRSDYPNQINNVLGFPFIFRGALDVQARTINEQMKIAAARALAALAREDVPDVVMAAFLGRRPMFGPDYIIPAPFDPRLISRVSPAVAQAAMESGVARRPIVDMDAYVAHLDARLDPVSDWMRSIFERLRAEPKRIVFAEGEDPAVIRAASSYAAQGFGTPVLVGTESVIRERFREAGVRLRDTFEIVDARSSELTEEFTEFLYTRLQRRGFLKRDCHRMVMNERNVFAALLVAHGFADGMVAGVTRNWASVFEDVRRVIDPRPGRHVVGVTLVLVRGRAVLVADTNVHETPTAAQLADIAIEAAGAARKFGMEPRVALLTYSTFGQPPNERAGQVREAVQTLADREVDFEFDGDIAADAALSADLMKLYPFCRLTGPANVLVMPAVHAASISTKLLKELGGAMLIGPLLVGLEKSVQISPLGAKDADILNLAALAAYDLRG